MKGKMQSASKIAVVAVDDEAVIRIYVVPVVGYDTTGRSLRGSARGVKVKPVVQHPNGQKVRLSSRPYVLLPANADEGKISAAKLRVEDEALRQRAAKRAKEDVLEAIALQAVEWHEERQQRLKDRDYLDVDSLKTDPSIFGP